MKNANLPGGASARSYPPFVEAVGEEAVRSFRESFGSRSFAPVVVVIAAYNEEESIGRVLESIEPEACGLALDVLVVDDGSADRTKEVAQAHSAQVVRLERNGGQGLAFRVGYQLAREHGARYIVTLDADGQWDPSGIPRVLEPLVAGEADFVLGSRVLGRSEADDAVRRAGVRFYAALVRLLTGVPVTDTSSGLRAMRAELTGRVRQEQVQYQAAELLIGAIYLGYRITERPVLMRNRIGGESKKGHNFLYGLRYGRVVVRTWWRERRAARPSVLPSTLALARRHRLFLALLGLGLALRVVVALAYAPALLRPDSISYLRVASHSPKPWRLHPLGYPTFLRILPFDWSLAIVPAVQHILGLVIATIIYVTLARLGVRHWLAALAAAPLLLDAYQLNIEQYVLAETLFELFLVAACALLLWHRPPGLASAGLAGLLFAAAALTRSIGTVAVLAALVAALFLGDSLPLRARLARPAVMLVLFAIPIVGYAAWFQSVQGKFALTTYGGRFLYGRVVPFADCTKFSVPESERILCPKAPPGERLAANHFLWWNRYSPVYRLDPPPGTLGNEIVGDFARRVVRNQPLDYAAAVGSDLLRSFSPVRDSRRDDVPLSRWQFQGVYRVAGDPDWGRESARAHRKYEFKRADPALAGFLRGYQRFVYTWGPLLAVALLAAFAAALGLGRAARSGLRSAAFLFGGTGLVLLLTSIASTIFSWRYQLPLIVLIPPAGALGLAALLGARASERPVTSMPAGSGAGPAAPGTGKTVC